MKLKSKLLVILISLTMVFSTLTPCVFAQQPYSSYWFPNELLDWNPDSDENAQFNKGSIPLAERFVGNAVNSNAMDYPKVAALSTMYPHTSGVPSQGSEKGDVYAFNYWQYIDILVMWGGSAGEGLILSPSADVIDAAHKNGVKVLGTIFFPPGVYGGKFEWVQQLLHKNSDGSFPVADKLIEVAEYYGFDGWFINQETEGGNSSDAQRMQEFLKYIQNNKPEGMHIMWYDAMSNTGSVSWQNALTNSNKMFFQDGNEKVSDSIFLNFWWRDMSSSHQKAESLGRSPYDVFAGINVEENGYNAGVSWDGLFPEGEEARASLAMYRPDWNYRTATNREQFYENANRFWVGANRDPRNTQTSSDWKGIAHYIVAKSTINSFPFVTNFNTGNGDFYAVNGEIMRNKKWSNRSLQNILPTWRWIVDSDGQALNPSIDWATSYYGGSSLKVEGDLSPQNTTNIQLYKTDLAVNADTELSVTYKVPLQSSNMKVGISFTDNPNEFEFLDVGAAPPNEWTTKTFSLREYAGNNIGVISLKFESSETIDNYSVNIGQLAVRDSKTLSQTLPAVSNLTILDNEFNEGIYTDARLKWEKLDEEVEVYEIYRINSDGTKQFVGATPNNVYYIPEIARAQGEQETALEVKALNKNYWHGDAAQVSFQWPSLPVPEADFEANKTVAAPGAEITFTDKSSQVTEEVYWEFPGGIPTSSTERQPVVKYNNEGTYNVILTAKNSAGEDVITKENFILIKEGAKDPTNVALNKSVLADTYVSAERPELAVDGATAGNSKWCAVGDEPHWLSVDLGSEYNICKFVVKHAETGGESSGFNTRNFKIQLSDNGQNWTDVVNIQDNTLGETQHIIQLTSARYVRLWIEKATQSADSAARIYEFEVYGYKEN